MKTVITEGTIIAMDSSLPKVMRGDIAIDGRKIISVGSSPHGFTPDRIIDGSSSIVLPGHMKLCRWLLSMEPGLSGLNLFLVIHLKNPNNLI